MRKVAVILLALVLMCGGIACTSLETWDIGRYLGSIQVLAADGNSSSVAVEGNIMAVFYTRADERVLFWCSDAQIIDNGDGLWDVVSPQLIAYDIEQSSVNYDLYRYMPFYVDYANPPYLNSLGLQNITWEDLPQSLHIAALESVALVSGSPRANVTRLYMGQEFLITNCRVSLQAYIAYGGGNITLRNHAYGLGALQNANCFVLVYFISETPYGTEIGIPVVIDKVIK
jgi:hypothetical protein